MQPSLLSYGPGASGAQDSWLHLGLTRDEDLMELGKEKEGVPRGSELRLLGPGETLAKELKGPGVWVVPGEAQGPLHAE